MSERYTSGVPAGNCGFSCGDGGVDALARLGDGRRGRGDRQHATARRGDVVALAGRGTPERRDAVAAAPRSPADR